MIAYRIQDKSGKGPYRHPKVRCRDWAFDALDHLNERTHPTRDDDLFGLRYSFDGFNLDEYVFGFNSLDQLEEWFDSTELEILWRMKFFIYKYDVNKEYVIEGKSKRQIMFLKEKAKKIGTYK